MQDSVVSLFNTLATKLGSAAVLHYIQAQTEIAPVVVEEWMAGKRTPSSGIQKAIFHCLRNARPEDFPPEPEPPRVPLTTKPVGRPFSKSLKRRESIVERNEQELFAIRRNLNGRGVLLDEVEL